MPEINSMTRWRANVPAITRSDTTTPPGALRGTDGSNPVPSSRQSVSFRISPPFPEKPGFSAGARGPSRATGVDLSKLRRRSIMVH
jgi:hypothetical protein